VSDWPERTPADVHRDWLNGLLMDGELIYQLMECGADDETVRREVPDRELLKGYFEYVRKKRSGELVGFVSETDVLESRAVHRKLIEIMTRNVTRVFQDCPVEEVVDVICARRIKQIPVIDRDRVLVGMVTCKEVIRHLFGRDEGGNR